MTLPDEKRDPLLLDHNYDGIQELDNPLPRWWVYLFVLCCIFAGIYFSYYTFFGGPTLTEELEQKMIALSPKKSDLKIEDFSGILHDPKTIADGKAIFESKCVSCHSPQGQGLIGPNLTDNYWIHGKGKVEDIFVVVRDGVPDKGMMTWGPLLKPEELRAVAVFVHSLKGTNPPNPKEHQGEEVEDEVEEK